MNHRLPKKVYKKYRFERYDFIYASQPEHNIKVTIPRYKIGKSVLCIMKLIVLKFCWNAGILFLLLIIKQTYMFVNAHYEQTFLFCMTQEKTGVLHPKSPVSFLFFTVGLLFHFSIFHLSPLFSFYDTSKLLESCNEMQQKPHNFSFVPKLPQPPGIQAPFRILPFPGMRRAHDTQSRSWLIGAS